MARTASTAIGGYYKTPTHLLKPIASLIRVEDESDYAIFDPCAGDGEAIVELAKAWWPKDATRRDVKIYANEMEKTRFDALKARQGKDGLGHRWPEVTHGDAFALQWDEAKASIAYVNSPYDLDKEHGRLEEKFLLRFVDVIRDGGALFFVVPFYALAKSADTIARHFSEVHCVRFPEGDFEIFKQVVLVAKKHSPLIDPDPEIRAKVLQWAADASTIPDTWTEPFFDVYAHDEDGISGLKMFPLDVERILQRAKPWHSTDRGGRFQPIVGVVPDKPAHEGLDRVFPVALPLKPAYLASGIAAGVFNGELIRPDDPESTLPNILLKGVFRKDFVHVPSEDKRNKDGEKTAEIHVQQPELVITILDLRTKKYSELLSSVDTTGEMDPAKMSVGDLLQHYGKSMMASMLKSCPVIHDPAKDVAVSVPSIARPLYTAQAHAVTAALKVLGGVDIPLAKRKGQACFILGEVGVGKTGVALATSVAMGAKRTLVMCPPHLVPEWQEQVSIWFPEHRSIVLDDVRDVHALAESTDDRPTIAIFSRETAKLSHAWAGIGPRLSVVRGERLELPARCPKCNSVPEMAPETLAAKRATCTVRKRRALNAAAKFARRLGFILAKSAPKSQHVVQVLNSHVLRRAVAKWTSKPVEGAWDETRDGAAMKSFAQDLFGFVAASESREHVQKFGEALLLLLVSLGSENAFQTGARAMYAAGTKDPYGYGEGAEKRQLALKLLACCEKETRVELAKELRESFKPDYGHARDALNSLWTYFDSSMEDFDTERSISSTTYKPRNDDGWGDHGWQELSGALAAQAALCQLASWGESEPCGERLYQAIPEPRRVALAPYIAKRFPKLFDCIVFDECFVRGTTVSGRKIEDIAVGDMVEAYDEKTKHVVMRKVTRLYRSAPKSVLIRVVVGGRVIVCTPGHPFFTQRGWVIACELLATDHALMHELRNNQTTDSLLNEDGNRAKPLDRQLQHVQRPDHSDGARDVPCEELRSWILQQGVQQRLREEEGWRVGSADSDEGQGNHSFANAHEEPNAQSGAQGEGYGFAIAKNGLETARTWWQRQRSDGTTESDCGCTGVENGDPNWDRPTETKRVSEELQDRCWERVAEDSDRSGRRFAQHATAQSVRYAEGRVLTWTRVESVQVLEPGSDGTFGGVCPDGLVYNLEVEELHTYIANDVVVHNCHELSNNMDSAQSQAMMRLAQLGAPVLALTGSIMNGYAKSMFAGQWALDPDFRREFERNQEGKFVQRYGYIKIRVEMKDSDGKNVSFGAVSDRVERTEREAGNAPGVLPLFVLQYLLKKAVVIHKDDLAIDLPPCVHIVEHIAADSALHDRYKNLASVLKNQIKRDAFGPLAGKLFGQVSELPSYLDRATDDMGNCSDGWWRIRYPEDCEGGLVAEQQPFARDVISSKEQWIIDRVRSELAEGRNVLVFGYHAEVLPRLRRLIQEQLSEPCALLLAGNSDRVDVKRSKKSILGEGPVAKVDPAKRKPWIQDNVVARGIRVMVVNSTAVQTGLNNLVHFNSIIWVENPACNPIGFRQANGRIFRPGQKKETRIYFPVYEDTAQESAHSLLMLKVGVSEGTDGLDARGAMAAAGVGEQQTMSAFGVGKQLFQMMEDERARVPRPTARAQGKTFEPVKIFHEPTDPILPSLRTPQKTAEIEQLKLF